MCVWCKNIIVAVSFLLPLVLFGQQTRKFVGELKADSVYVSLFQEEQQLHVREASLNKTLQQLRGADEIDSDKAERISALEMELFSIQRSIVDISSEIDAIEQQWQIDNIAETEPTVTVSGNNESDAMSFDGLQSADNTNAILVDNAFFRSNLPQKEYEALLEAQKDEKSVAEEIKRYGERYDNLKRLDSAYYEAVSLKEADSLFAERERIDSVNKSQLGVISDMWNNGVYNVKSYCYNYIIDRNNKVKMLDTVESMLAEMRAEMSSMNTRSVAEIASYPYMKRFLLKYEMMLANATGNVMAADSLKGEIDRLVDDEYVYYSNIAPKRATDIEYEQAETSSVAKYNYKNPIPKVKMESDGPVYSILLGRYNQAQSPAIFRNAFPLFYDRDENNKYCYYAGYYPTRQTAEHAAAMLKSKGFRNPIVIDWNKDVFENMNIGSADKTQGRTDIKQHSAAVRYRVEITVAEGTLSSELKEVITSTAPDKELSRMVDDGLYIFYVGSFDSKDAADKLAEKLSAVSGKIKVVVNEIQ